MRGMPFTLGVGTQGDATLQTTMTSPTPNVNSSYAYTVSISDTFAAIGDPSYCKSLFLFLFILWCILIDEYTGCVYLYRLVSGTWSYTQVLYLSSSLAARNSGSNPPVLTPFVSPYYYAESTSGNLYDSFFGNGIDIDVNYLIVGAPGYGKLVLLTWIGRTNHYSHRFKGRCILHLQAEQCHLHMVLNANSYITWFVIVHER